MAWNIYSQTISKLPFVWHKLPGEFYYYFSTRSRYIALKDAHERLESRPILNQRDSFSFDSHYTYQAAWAMRRIQALQPEMLVDISSDIRFITMISAVTPVVYTEYRANNLRLDNIISLQSDILHLPFEDQSLPAVSCLHVVEHIGLGRYGDKINPKGWHEAIQELGRVIKPGGSLFISVPVGQAVTFFNAHRVYDPVKFPQNFSAFDLREFSGVTTLGKYLEATSPAQLSDEDFGCGLYWFVRR